MLNASDYISLSSLVAGFGVAMIFFRIQREDEMKRRGEENWVPWADFLVIVATLASLLLVLFPVLFLGSTSRTAVRISASFCSGSVLLVSAYIPAILAHYRLVFGRSRTGARENPEPAERWWVVAGLVGAALVTVLRFNMN